MIYYEYYLRILIPFQRRRVKGDLVWLDWVCLSNDFSEVIEIIKCYGQRHDSVMYYVRYPSTATQNCLRWAILSAPGFCPGWWCLHVPYIGHYRFRRAWTGCYKEKIVFRQVDSSLPEFELIAYSCEIQTSEWKSKTDVKWN